MTPPSTHPVEVQLSTREYKIAPIERKIRDLLGAPPLIELGMSRADCQDWLDSRGWQGVVKSACVGCPFRTNAEWRRLRDEHPDEWDQAVAFDRAIRRGGARGRSLTGRAYLHRSRVPLDEAPIDLPMQRRSAGGDEWLAVAEEGELSGCSPYECRSGPAVDGRP